jgi:hypothetical protein
MRSKPLSFAALAWSLAIACWALAPAALGAEESGWVSLGRKTVTFRADRDLMEVRSGKETFSKLKIEVEGNDLEIEKMIVAYGSGASDEIAVRHSFKEGSRSRIIDLRGRDRSIVGITFFYKTSGRLREGRASIEVFGL